MTTITWTAPTGTPGIAGKTFTGGKVVEQNGETLVDFGTVKINGKNRRLKVRVSDKPSLAAQVKIVQEAKRAEEAAAAAAKKAELEAIVSGATTIDVDYYDGEYLSGYTVHGPAAKLLCELGLAKEVSGWGVHVESNVIDTLGKSFTYPQAIELARPALEEKQATSDEKAAKRTAIFAAAKETGKPVVLAHWMDDCNDPREECSTDSVTEYAMPDGTTEIQRSHTW